MKTKHLFLTSFGATALLGLSTLSAQEGGPPRDGGNRLAEMIKRADTNADGKISKEEFVSARKAELEEQFSKLDTNADGQADEAEMKAIANRMREGGPRREGGEGTRRPEGGGGPESGFRRPPGEGGRPEGAPPPPQGGPEGGRRPDGPPPGQGGPGGPRGAMAGGMGALFQLMNPEGFSQVDKNGDGSIDAAEFKDNAAKSAEQGFGRLDQDKDGKVTQEEVRKAGEMIRSMMGGRGPGGEGRPGGEGGGFRRPGGGEGRPGGEGGGFRRPPSEGGDAPKPEGEGKKEGSI